MNSIELPAVTVCRVGEILRLPGPEAFTVPLPSDTDSFTDPEPPFLDIVIDGVTVVTHPVVGVDDGVGVGVAVGVGVGVGFPFPFPGLPLPFPCA